MICALKGSKPTGRGSGCRTDATEPLLCAFTYSTIVYKLVRNYRQGLLAGGSWVSSALQILVSTLPGGRNVKEDFHGVATIRPS